MPNKQKATLIKILPIKRRINNETEYDSLLIWYRDENGIKRTRFIPHAEVPYYIIKDKTCQEAITPPMFIEKDKVEEFTVYSDMLYREIAAKTDSLAYYDRVLLNYGKNSSNMKNLLKHNWIYNSDMDISDRYIKNFNEEFEPDMNYKLHKCYMDIEVDLMPNGFKKNLNGSIGYVGFPDEEVAPCPVNIISFVDGKSMIAYSFILRNSLNTSEIEFERAWGDEKKKEVIEMVRDRNNILLNDIIVNFYNSEEETIEAYFNKTHEIDPDIILSWNQGFDLISMMNRLTKLYNKKKELKEQGIRGYDQMLSTVCDSKYMYQEVGDEGIYLTPRAKFLRRPEQSYVDRLDEFICLDGINYIDHLVDVKYR